MKPSALAAAGTHAAEAWPNRDAHELLTEFRMEAFAELARAELEATGEPVRKRAAERAQDSPFVAHAAGVARLLLTARVGPKRNSRAQRSCLATPLSLRGSGSGGAEPEDCLRGEVQAEFARPRRVSDRRRGTVLAR